MLAHHGHPQEISNMIKSCSLWLFCWNWYSLWQKQIHQHWRIKFKFWVNSSRLWDNHCRLHLSTIQPDHPDHPKRRRMARVQTMLIHLGLKAAPAYRPIARKWNQRNGTAAAIKHLRLFFFTEIFLSHSNSDHSSQSAGPWQVEERWTLFTSLMLHHLAWSTLMESVLLTSNF